MNSITQHTNSAFIQSNGPLKQKREQWKWEELYSLFKSYSTKQIKTHNRQQSKKKKNGTNEETWQERGERAGIDGITFILQEVIRLKEVCARDEQLGGSSDGPMCTSKEIQRQRRQKDGLSCTGERWWCFSTSFWGEGCKDLAVEKKGEQKVMEGDIKKRRNGI